MNGHFTRGRRDSVDFVRVKLKELFSVNKIITIFYFELSKTFYTLGEAHDFWELVYVDKGEATVIGGDKSYSLSAGQVIFHKPNEFHIVKANGMIAPNIAIATFECISEEMGFFSDKVFSLSDTEKGYIADIIKIGTTAFDWCNSQEGCFLKRSAKAVPGDEQIIKISLELLLLQLLRRDKVPDTKVHLTPMPKLRHDEAISNNITAYLKQNLSQPVTLSEISKHFGMSVSSLKKIYRSNTGASIISSMINLRVTEAKRLIRESSCNFTQIADMTGFSSVHHMSAVFKGHTGMTPSEYSLSIKCRDV